MGKIVITKQHMQQQSRLLLVLFDERKPYLMEMAPMPGEEGILGNIYLARVKDVVPGINGAFLMISSKEKVYLPLTGCGEILVANRELPEGGCIQQGDEVVVQIVGEALKTKQPTASEKLSLAGQYCVLSYFGHGICYSKKLGKAKRKHIERAIRPENKECDQELGRYQLMIRTNAGNLENFEPLFEEIRSFTNIFDSLTQIYQHRTCYSCLYHREPEIISLIKNIPLTAYDEIVTDEREVAGLLEDFFTDKKIRLYQDDLLPLSKLYSIETHLREALSKRVWLPCGGYLVIEPTEAMVVIDVNSGKAESKGKGKQEYYLKINLEAAKEVARQLRIRNYSGIILVDFINMESDENNHKLLERLKGFLEEDRIRVELVDMTALGIVEITRKKERRPLADYYQKQM